MLLLAIVVCRDRASTDVCTSTNLYIAEIGVVANLCTSTDAWLFQLCKGANVDLALNLTAGAHMCIWADIDCIMQR